MVGVFQVCLHLQGFNARLTPPKREGFMVLHSTRWLALSYFTYFFSYGIFLPFWSVWLKGTGLTPETIGLLLGAAVCPGLLGWQPRWLADGDHHRL